MELTVRPNLSAAQVYKFLVVVFFFQMPCSFCAFIKKTYFFTISALYRRQIWRKCNACSQRTLNYMLLDAVWVLTCVECSLWFIGDCWQDFYQITTPCDSKHRSETNTKDQYLGSCPVKQSVSLFRKTLWLERTYIFAKLKLSNVESWSHLEYCSPLKKWGNFFQFYMQ